MINIFFIFCMMYGYRQPLSSVPAAKIDPRCYGADYVRAWVYFTDKGISTDYYGEAIKTLQSRMNRASLNRRALRSGTIDFADLPLSDDYINEIAAQGGLLIRSSKWLNAASFWIAKQDLKEIDKLDFVYKITKVATFQPPQEVEMVFQDTTVFGITYQQLKMFNIDKLHAKGIYGSNIKIGILDSGLRRKHIALNNTKIIGEYDFLDHDQVFFGNIPVTEQGGVYSDIAFQKTAFRLNLFLVGDYKVSDIYPTRDIFYTYSTDNGIYWEPPINLTNNTVGNWVTELDICGRDTIFIFFRDRYGIKYIGYSVINDVFIGSGTLTGISYREPAAVQIEDTIYLVYQNKQKLYLQKGNSSGFIPRINIDSAASNIKAPDIVNRNNTQIGIFYHTALTDSIYYIKSNLPVGSTTFTKKYLGQGKDARAITSSDTIYLIWKDTSFEPLFRIGFRRSSDFDTTFTSPAFLSDYLNSIGKISIEKISNKITVAWESEGKIYSISSFDNGNNFTNLDSLSKPFAYLPTLGTDDSEIIKFYTVRGDSITDGYIPTDPDYSHPRHGTEMIGLIGGYVSGYYVGVAPDALFLVAKTENPATDYELPVEEDTWVSGLEWVESQGADIVTSSLGYTTWYEWPADYDGYTSPASIAAYEATKRGMIIVNAAGNLTLPQYPQIVIPGDAAGVITVGGIDTLFNRWESSGYFPTENHTVKKPEIMCLSAAPIVVNPDTTDAYLYSFGTSGATAMVSGICALLLEGHPNWNVDSIRNALFHTASFYNTPTDSMGYGWPDALAAFNYAPPQIDTISGNVFLTPYPNPFITSRQENIYLPFKLNQATSVELRVYSISGRLVKKEERQGQLLPGHYADQNPLSPNAAFIWDGKDENGGYVGSGIYYCLLITRGAGNNLVKIAVIR